MKYLIIYLIVFFILGPVGFIPRSAWSNDSTPEVDVGDIAKNIHVLPPWSMRKCPKDFYATYDLDGAKKLKKADAECALWYAKIKLFEVQTTKLTATIKDLTDIISTHKKEHELDQQRIQTLIKQINMEIKEKNKYKYKPNYTWLFIAGGAVIALAGLCFGVGVWVTKHNE